MASPGQALSTGWDYFAILKSLGDVAELQPEDFATAIVRHAYPAPGAKDHALSAYALAAEEDVDGEKMSRIEAVKKVFDALAVAMYNNPAAWDYAKTVRGKASNGGARSRSSNGSPLVEYFDDLPISTPRIPNVFMPESNWLQTPLFDLYSLSDALRGAPWNISSAKDLADLMDRCVLASSGMMTRRYYNGRSYSQTPLLGGFHGLAFFFPDGDLKIQGRSSYQYQWWYTGEDTTDPFAWPSPYQPPNYNPDKFYGKLDFCASVDEGNNAPDSWRELLEWSYDQRKPPFTFPPATPGGF